MVEIGRGGVALLLATFTLLQWPRLANSRYLRFEPGFEYQYKFQSDAQVHRVDKFTMEARVGYTCMGDVEEGQEIKLRVIALNLRAGTAPGEQGHNWDFSKWFSFVLTPRGEVVHVHHAADEDEETLAVKKGLAALLAARLHDHRDHDEVTIIKTGEGWRYHVQEVGHEGPHNATYDVRPSKDGKIFTKTRHNHPMKHATGSYSKTIHYHDDMKIIHAVEIEEHFDALNEPPEGYNPYIVGHERPKAGDEEEQAGKEEGASDEPDDSNGQHYWQPDLHARPAEKGPRNMNLSSAFCITWVERTSFHQSQTPVVQILISLAFEPEKHAQMFQTGELRHRVLLTMGALIRLMAAKEDERAPELASRLQSMLGLHEAIEEDQWKVVLIEALGNAALDQSYEHIVSHVNNSNSHTTARNSSTFIDPSTMDLTALATHHRQRRAANGLFDPIELFIQSPSVDWQKQLGSSKIGASFGLTIKNELDVKIDLLSGHGKIDIYDEAFGQVNLGFMGINVDILRARLCFRGHAEYNLNLFQEFDVNEITRVTKMFDELKQQTVDAVVNGIKLFKKLLDGDTPFADIIKSFADAIKKLPDKIVAVGKKAVEALLTIGQYDDKELPPFIIPLKNLVMKVSNLINDIRSDVMGFYNKLMTATVVIPYGGKQIFKSVKEIIDSFKDFNKDPKAAVSTVTGNTLTVGIQVKAMVDAVKDAKEAAFFLKKEKPYWWDMRAQARELLNMSLEVKTAMLEQGPAWVKEQVQEVKDDIKQFTNGQLSTAELKQQVIDDLLALPAIAESILPLEDLGDEIGQAFTDLFDLVEQIKKAYDELREGTRKAKQFIERVFGPKAHKHFPRQTRTPGGKCDGKGFYPATLESSKDPEYAYEGVDLLLSERSNVVAPFPGIIYLSDNANEVIIESRGGSPRNVDFIITNVKANSTVRLRTDPLYNELEVAAGQVIGEATKSPCNGFNHIHFAIRKGNKTLDPTRYVEPRLPEMPQWIQECDDYKYVYKGKTLAAGSVVGLAGRDENDTSPEREPEVEKPDAIPDSKDPSSELDSDVTEPTSVAKRVQDNKQQAKDTAMKSKDSGLKTLFQSATTFLKKFNIKDMKMGALVKLLSALQFDDSLAKLTNVFQTIQAMLDNKPCLNPNQMSDDDLAAELRKQGKSTVGSRAELITRYTARSDSKYEMEIRLLVVTVGCMTLSLGLPKQMYCTMDQQCLGLECCLDIKVAFFRKVYKLYARFDPCSFNFIVGISDLYEKSFGPDYGLDDIFGVSELKDSLKSQKDKFVKSGKELGKEDTTDEPPCERPDKMTEETLAQSLESRGLVTSGTMEEKIARLELADRTCSILGKTLTLPAITNDKLAKIVYMTLDDKCFGDTGLC
nr:hypothetical protein BaRGS_005183 [Batillaria attramentaria]